MHSLKQKRLRNVQSLIEAVLRSLAGTKSGLHRSFVIIVGFLLAGNLLSSAKTEEDESRPERKKGLPLFVLFTRPEHPGCVSV